MLYLARSHICIELTLCIHNVILMEDSVLMWLKAVFRCGYIFGGYLNWSKLCKKMNKYPYFSPIFLLKFLFFSYFLRLEIPIFLFFWSCLSLDTLVKQLDLDLVEGDEKEKAEKMFHICLFFQIYFDDDVTKNKQCCAYDQYTVNNL